MTLHRCPSQCSTRGLMNIGWKMRVLCCEMTPAAQTLSGLMATSDRKSVSTLPGSTDGLCTTVQAVPSQRSVRVSVRSPLSVHVPPAQASDVERAPTALRVLLLVPTLGLATIDQLLPFQCSMSV